MGTLKFNSEHKTFEEQLNIFEKRGVQIEDRNSSLEKIKAINYYKIKEFSIPFIDKLDENGEIVYKTGTTFTNITNRFYEDKNLRVNFLRIIEKFEISVKAQLAHVLGGKYGAVGYLEF